MKNSVASVLNVIGIATIIIGIITAFSIGDDFGTALAVMSAVYSFISGMLFIGFGEVIRLLHEMNERNREPLVVQQSSKDGVLTTLQDNPPPTKITSNEIIEEFYEAKGLRVEAIYNAPVEDTYFVSVNGVIQLVELGGFTPKIIPQEKWTTETQESYKQL
ncbi:hypothetical protein [Metabacillus sp. SLBN-84]